MSSQSSCEGWPTGKDTKRKMKGKDAPPETPPWKRMAKAIFVAIAIDAIFLAALLVPIVGFVIVLAVGPYTGAMVAGKWLMREPKGEWLWSTFWVAVLWPSALTGLIIGLITSIGPFQLVFDSYGIAIIASLYILTAVFTLIGFYQGSVIVEKEEAPPKKEPKKVPLPEKPAAEAKPETDEPVLERPAEEERYPGEGGIDE